MADQPKTPRAAAPDLPPMGVTLGTYVEVELLGEAGAPERLAFDVVADQHADLSAGFLGIGTPMGQAIVGRTAGDTVPYRLADVASVRIIRVAASRRAPDVDLAHARQAAAREAVARHDREEMTRLSLTFDSKWGQWDPGD